MRASRRSVMCTRLLPRGRDIAIMMHCMPPLAMYLRTAHSSMVQFKCLSNRARSFGGKPAIRTWAWQIGKQGVEYCNELKIPDHCIPAQAVKPCTSPLVE
jgi:hypothetical protein